MQSILELTGLGFNFFGAIVFGVSAYAGTLSPFVQRSKFDKLRQSKYPKIGLGILTFCKVVMKSEGSLMSRGVSIDNPP